MAQTDLQKRLASIEGLVREIEATADPALRATVQKLLECVMDLHGAGLERILEVARAGDSGERLVGALVRDDLVTSLLVLYGLHPLDLETRLNQGLEQARSRLKSRGGDLELLGIQDGTVRLRLRANGHGCGSTADALKELVEDSIYQAAPDIATLVIEGANEQQGFVPVQMLQGVL